MSRHALSRRVFLQWSALGVCTLASGTQAQQTAKRKWYDVREWGVEGKGWQDTAAFYDRLPARAEATVRPEVWQLSRNSAGMVARFRTDATALWADYEVTSDRLALPHMPATGVSGLDLYAETPEGVPRWLAVTRPDKQAMNVALVTQLAPGERTYSLYLPLYNGTRHLKVGVPDGATFTPLPPRQEKPIVFYGTSITHGACASRPGMPHPAILGRRLQRPVINLGFSGNGKMEAEVGEFLAELPAAVFVIDCLPNMLAPEIQARTVPLVRQLRAAQSDASILLVEDRTYTNAPFLPALQARHETSRAALRDAYRALTAEGLPRLAYLEGETLLGEDRDDTTDGSHPNDLGFVRHADAFEPLLRAALSS